MRLTIVGCTGSMAGPEAAASSYLLEADDADGRTWRVLLDCGSGAFGPLQALVDPTTIDAVGVTHMHPDHFADLCGLYVYLRYHPTDGTTARQCERPLEVRGPEGAGAKVAATFGMAPEEDFDCMSFSGWDGDPWQVGPMRVEAFRVEHPVEAYALRVTGPSDEDPSREVSVVYSGDTDECDGIVEAARDADLLLVEAAFLEGRDEPRGIHLTGVRAGRVATRAGARRVVLTHLQPWTDPVRAVAEATTTYAGPIDLARPRAVHVV
ncbi:MBL fold metallo-hydrolase [Sanguibacter massiliensis]|uniref:MBL fold metallo-hydrolase n=1 Tax=Sanguibacter massiliensis TaxID=1973217 RepID=UPI000C8662F1|nr:MBL fold metallo-hydrolase [Sanguibacter massiliensis]